MTKSATMIVKPETLTFRLVPETGPPIGMSDELAEDFAGLRSPVPLEWLLSRFLAYHINARTLDTLGSGGGPVLTTSTYDSYIGEPASTGQADAAVLRLVQSWLRAGIDGPIPVSTVFASTNLDKATLMRSVNGLVAQGHLLPSVDDSYRVEGSVLGVKVEDSGRRMEPVPMSRHYQEIPIQALEPFCFVIMPLREEEHLQRQYVEVIKPLLKQEFGIDCYRVDEDNLPDRIDNKIYTYLIRADFVIAETTTRNPNVMYELGLAHALNKRCVLLTQGEASTLPFDVSRIAVSPYSNDGELRDRLRKTVSALRGLS